MRTRIPLLPVKALGLGSSSDGAAGHRVVVSIGSARLVVSIGSARLVATSSNKMIIA